jgi:hypothetical protein
MLILFTSSREGRSRRVEGFLSQVLQRRRNHDTFAIHNVTSEQRPDLLEKFAISETPTLLVVDGNRVKGRLSQPRGCQQINAFLSPWLK